MANLYDIRNTLKNKWQQKILSADVTTDTTVSDLTFSNLTAGKTYRITWQFRTRSISADPTVFVMIYHNTGVTVIAERAQSVSGETVTITDGGSTIVTLVGTTIVVKTNSASADSLLQGDGTVQRTWLIVEELNQVEVGSAW